jgi:sugar lactone lactonase YvrE
VNVFSGTTGAFISSLSVPSPCGCSAGIAVDAAGMIYVTDHGSGIIYKSSGGAFDVFATVPQYVEGLTIGPDEKLYVGTRDTRVLRFSLDGTPYGVGGNLFDPTFINDNRLNLAFSVAFDKNNMIYVTSAGTNEILRYSASGSFADTFVSANLGGLDYPTYMVFAPVPESSEWAMMALGVAVLGLGTRRRLNKA